MTYAVGDLVRVKDSEVDAYGVTGEWVTNHGWLWVVVGLKGHSVYAKPLSTGAKTDNYNRSFRWYNYELEKADV